MPHAQRRGHVAAKPSRFSMARPRPNPRGTFLAASLAMLSMLPIAARAEDPPRIALVIANTTYPGLPPLPQCTASAHLMSASLRQAGFQVMQADDASNGDIFGRLGALPARLHPDLKSDATGASPQGAAVLYVCGYAGAFDGRSYFLPASIQIEQPSDLLAQGVLLHSFAGATTAGGAASGLVLLDLVPSSGQPQDLPGLGTLTASIAPTVGLAVAINPVQAAGHVEESAATPFATAAAAALSAPHPEVGTVLAAIHDRFGPTAGKVVITAPTSTATLDPVTLPPPPSTTPPPPVVASLSPPAPSPAVTTPPRPPVDPATVTGRRTIQSDLRRLGYYAGPVDGIFGADSQAAMRRLQHELGAPLTGNLSPDQITQLQARTQ
jgi:hypothetical protein